MRIPASWHSTTRQLRLSAGFLAGALVQTGCYPGLHRSDDRLGAGDNDDEEVESAAGQAEEASLERPAESDFDLVLADQPIVQPLPVEVEPAAEPAIEPAAAPAVAADDHDATLPATARPAAADDAIEVIEVVDAAQAADAMPLEGLIADAHTGATPVHVEPPPESPAAPRARPRDPAVHALESSQTPSPGLLTSGSYGYAPIGGLY